MQISMKRFQNVLVLLILVSLFWSCNRNPKNQGEGNILEDTTISHVEDSLSSNFVRDVLDSEVYKINDIHVCDLSVDRQDNTGNIPLSDYFGFSDHPDSLVIPKGYLGKRNLKIGDFSFLKVQGEYRKHFLEYNGKKEIDSIFIFNFQRDTVLSYQIKDVSIVASLNPYFEPNKYPITQDEFMIGFELNKNQLGVLSNGEDGDINLVYVGKSNPFVMGKIKPILWKKVDDSLFPKNAKIFNPNGYEKYYKRTIGTFKFETNELIYFVQMKSLTDNINSNLDGFEGRHFVVVDPKDQMVVYEKSDAILHEGDEGSLYSLKDDITKELKYLQWTGTIFKNKPSIIYFNDHPQFGCQSIYFLDSKEPPIVIGCDNRH
jgi:hypothetical protein